MSDQIAIYADFAKVDVAQRTIFGYASTPTRDQQGEIITLDAVRKALPGYLKYPAVRVMHQPVAVGTGIEAVVDGKGLWFGAKIVDDDAWKKCISTPPVYRGFSMGGKITKRDPDDRSIATEIRLDEVSLVDRPANPDAQFSLIKRAGDGLLHVQPTQCWTCGIPGHQHTSKSECQGCIERQSLRLQARFKPDGAYASLDDIRDDARTSSDVFSKLAEEHRVSARQHLEQSLYAKKASDTITAEYHDVMAKSFATLAGYHERTAQHFQTISAFSEDDKMDGSALSTLTEAESAVEALKKTVSSSEITGVKSEELGKAQTAHTQAVQSDANAISHVADAVQSHASAAAHIADGEPDKAKHQVAEADSHRTIASFQAEAAQSFHEMVASHIKPKAGDSVHSTNEDTTVNKEKVSETGGKASTAGAAKEGAEVAHKLAKASREHNENMVKELTNFAKKFGDMMEKAKKTGDKFREDNLAECMKAAQDWAKKRQEFAKNMGVIETSLKDMAEDKGTNPDAGDMTGTPSKIGVGDDKGGGGDIHKGVKPNSKLITIGQFFYDKKGNWFGKRDFSDKKRKELADSGAAMPDGSFPIENQEDVNNAAHLVGHAHNPTKAKAHIKARAKAVGAKLPDSWKDDDGDTKKAACDHEFGKGDNANKCMKCGFMSKREPKPEGANADEMGDENKDGKPKYAAGNSDPEPDQDDGKNKGKKEFRDFDDDDPVAKSAHAKLMRKRVKGLAKSVKKLAKIKNNSSSLFKVDGAAMAKAHQAIADEITILSQQPMFKGTVYEVSKNGAGAGWLRRVAASLSKASKTDEEREKSMLLTKRLDKIEKKLQRWKLEQKLLKKDDSDGTKLDTETAGKDPNASGSGNETGSGTPTQDSPSLKKAEQDLQRALHLIKTMTPMVKSVQASNMSLKGELAELKDQLKKYGGSPLPSPQRGLPHGIRSVDKTQDGVRGDSSVHLTDDETKDGGLLKTLTALPAGRQRAQALLDVATGRVKTR
jgi:hypothetical protein